MSEVENLIASTSGEAWVLKNDLCRCCHAEGSFKNMGIPYYFAGETEIYSDMLRECIDINIIPSDGFLKETTFKICDDCIGQLRAASNFRKQVLTCEISFRELCEKNLIRATAPIKIELEIFDEDKVKCEEESDNEGGFGNVGFDLGLSDDDDTKLEDVKIKKETAKKAKGKTKPPPKPKKGAKIKKTAKPKTTVKAETNAENNAETNAETETAKPYRKSTRELFRLTAADFVTEGASYRCLRCDRLYHKINSLKHHVKAKHYKIPRHVCSQPNCNQEFLTTAPFITHKLEVHNIDDRHKCNACKGTFNTKIQLKKHVNNFHMLGEKHKCDMCEYETFSFEGLYKHKYKHRTVKDFHCRFCRKSFLRKTTLDLHERIHTGDRRKVCTVCGQAFVQKASLNYHMAKYHPEVNF